MGRVHDEILLVLEELGGEVTDKDGRATRLIFQRMSTTSSFTTVSTAIKRLEERGKIVRDQPTLKSTTRVALARPGVRPGRKSLPVAMEQLSRTMAENVEATVRDVIEAERDAIRAEIEAEDREVIDLRVEELRNEIAGFRSQLQDRDNEIVALRASLDQVRRERDDALEARRIAEHNAEVWKRKRTAVPELMEQIRDRLSAGERRDLENMMREMRT